MKFKLYWMYATRSLFRGGRRDMLVFDSRQQDHAIRDAVRVLRTPADRMRWRSLIVRQTLGRAIRRDRLNRRIDAPERFRHSRRGQGRHDGADIRKVASLPVISRHHQRVVLLACQ